MNSFNFYIHRWWYFGLSLLVLIPGTISLIRYGLKLSIDFTGGTLLEIQIPNSKLQISNLDFEGAASIQPSDNNTYLLKFKELDASAASVLQHNLKNKYGEVIEKRFETVGPAIGKEQTRNAFLSIIAASGLIVSYIAWSFRSIPRPYSSWKFGVSAVIALLHDVLVVTGIFSILGHFYNVEVDALFVTAMLTVIGFSVHDTIVVFDRIKENLPLMPGSRFSAVVDFSLTETLVRSLNTSITAVLTLLALLIFGGESVRWFVVALLVGIVSGTYSSIFNAAQLLAVWEN